MTRTYALRRPRDKDDSPELGFMGGAVSVAVGTLAVAFAKTSFARTTREMTTINRLWKQDMTIAQLKTMALNNQPLPSVVLMKGRLNARGPPVRTATT